MNVLDFPFLAEIFFGMSLIVFCVALYVILPAFIYKKRTVFKPKLINAMWHKFFMEPTSKKATSGLFKKKSQKGIWVGNKRTSTP